MTILDELLRKELYRAPLLADRLVEQWLRELRIVALVVPKAPVAHHIQNHVVTPLLPVLGSHFEGTDYPNGIVRIAMENRHPEGLAQVRAILGGPGISRVSSEANLIVDDDMDGSAHVEVLHMCQLHRLINDTLTSKGSVTVQQDRHHPLPGRFRIPQVVLLCPRPSKCHRADSLQVGGVGFEREGYGAHIWVCPDVRCAEVVLHIARRGPVLSVELVNLGAHVVCGAHELGQHPRHWLAEDTHEHIEPTAVRHAEHKLLNAHLHAPVNQGLEARDNSLPAVNTEALHCLELVPQEALKTICNGQPLVCLHGLLLLSDQESRALHTLPDPVAAFPVEDVHIFDAKRAAIRGAEAVYELAESHVQVAQTSSCRKEASVATSAPTPNLPFGGYLLVHVLFLEPMELRREFGNLRVAPPLVLP
mmetsp:Transcript_53699/g.148935  ORF Transcript_53699/g.148935 Transcript_53699/m.148935 type:complete len:420 (+) Transcript_53699:1617-2876(+)